MTSTRNDKAIKIDKLKNPDIANPSLRKFYIHDKCIIWSFIRKDVIPNFENTYNLTILCNLHFTIIFNTTYSKPSISPNLRTLQIRSSHARLSGSYNAKHCQDNTICLLAKKKTYCVTSPMFTFPIAWAELRNASSFMDVTMMIFELIPGGNVIRCYYCCLIGTRISVGHCQQALWEAAFKCR